MQWLHLQGRQLLLGSVPLQYLEERAILTLAKRASKVNLVRLLLGKTDNPEKVMMRS
jgi:hypothetical protein